MNTDWRKRRWSTSFGGRGVKVKQQQRIKVIYDGIVAGDYFADLLLGDAILVELKAAKDSPDAFAAQCLNYLKATGLPLCQLLNSISANPVSQ